MKTVRLNINLTEIHKKRLLRLAKLKRHSTMTSVVEKLIDEETARRFPKAGNKNAPH